MVAKKPSKKRAPTKKATKKKAPTAKKTKKKAAPTKPVKVARTGIVQAAGYLYFIRLDPSGGSIMRQLSGGTPEVVVHAEFAEGPDDAIYFIDRNGDIAFTRPAPGSARLKR